MRESSNFLKRMDTRFRGYDGKRQASESPIYIAVRLELWNFPWLKSEPPRPLTGPPLLIQGATVLKTQDLHSAGGCQGVLALRMAFKMVNSFRIQAVKATLAGLPACRNRW